MGYNPEKREPKIAEMEKLFHQLDKQAAYLSEVAETIDQIDANLKVMTKYYTGGEWMQDYDKFHQLALDAKNYTVLLEDPIYDVLHEIHQSKLKLLKKIVANL